MSPPRLQDLLNRDGYLELHKGEIVRRYECFRTLLDSINKEGGVEKFCRSYKEFGLHVNPKDKSVEGLEWAPGAQGLYLKGDFNGWNETSHPYEKLPFGKWKIKIPAVGGKCPIAHLSKLKLVVKTGRGELVERLSPWATYVKPPENSFQYEMQFWNPPQPHVFKHKKVNAPESLKIYEAHVGISSAEGKVADYNYFCDSVVPRIKKQGYNAIQLMAIMEHAYYGCFGYQVTSFFAASSRFGTPDELKRLIDKPHWLGKYVLPDVVDRRAGKYVLACETYVYLTAAK